MGKPSALFVDRTYVEQQLAKLAFSGGGQTDGL